MSNKSRLLATSAGAAMYADAEGEEKEERKEDARKDASAGTRPYDEIMDAVTRCMDAVERMGDSFGKRFDRMDARMDAAEEELKREDKRKDGEDEKEEERKEDASRKDGENQASAFEKDEPERVAADKRKDAGRKDNAEDVSEEKSRQDAKRKDGEDEKEEEKHGDAVGAETLKAIRAELAELRAENRDLRRIVPKPITDADSAELLKRQAIADDVYVEHDLRAPSPMVNEDLGTYRRRLAIDLQKYSPSLKNADLWAVNDSASFDMLERQIYADATEAARNPVTEGLAPLRGVTRQQGGHTFTEYYGDSAGWMGDLAYTATRGRASVTEVMKAGNAR